MLDAIASMSQEMRRGRSVYHPSNFWEEYNEKNLRQLQCDGFENFKRTVALNYFTWLAASWRNPQLHYLVKQTNPAAWPALLRGLADYDPTCPLARREQMWYGLFVRLLWRFAARFDTEGLLRTVDEPLVGNPFRVFDRGKLLSQDLANSALEYYAIREHWSVPRDAAVTVCELGAGYGRFAYLLMQALPRARYIVVDIPPALYLAQRYLKAVLPHKRVFEFRPFERFDDVAAEFDGADMAFLLPHQAEQLPRGCVDLFVNISSLHEMRLDQIGEYLRLVGRVTRGLFYSKQWFVSDNRRDGLRVTADDYPIPPEWKRLYLRPAKVQASFFEALYDVGAAPPVIA